ncbi:hypothetical protein ATKI12_1756 [Kitasatospora sp. Ki12]
MRRPPAGQGCGRRTVRQSTARAEQPTGDSKTRGVQGSCPQGGCLPRRPQAGGSGVIQNSSTGPSPLRSSAQVRCLWTCAQRLSTGCGQLTARQWAIRVIHRLSPGQGRLSPGCPQPRPQFDNRELAFIPWCERRHEKLTGPRG